MLGGTWWKPSKRLVGQFHMMVIGHSKLLLFLEKFILFHLASPGMQGWKLEAGCSHPGTLWSVCILPWYIVLIIVIIGQFKMFLSLSTFRGCRISYLQKYSPCQGQAETWRECQASISRANLTFGHLDLIVLRILSIFTKTWRAGKS